MSLFNIIKNNLFIQNFVANIISLIPPYFEFSVAKYLAIKKAMFITAYDKTHGSYLEFGVFTGSSFNFAMKANKRIEKIFGKTDCKFVGFDSFEGFGEIKKEDENPSFKSQTFSINEKKVLNLLKRRNFALLKKANIPSISLFSNIRGGDYLIVNKKYIK